MTMSRIWVILPKVSCLTVWLIFGVEFVLSFEGISSIVVFGVVVFGVIVLFVVVLFVFVEFALVWLLIVLF